jgi:hypothetical protein
MVIAPGVHMGDRIRRRSPGFHGVLANLGGDFGQFPGDLLAKGFEPAEFRGLQVGGKVHRSQVLHRLPDLREAGFELGGLGGRRWGPLGSHQWQRVGQQVPGFAGLRNPNGLYQQARLPVVQPVALPPLQDFVLVPLRQARQVKRQRRSQSAIGHRPTGLARKFFRQGLPPHHPFLLVL